MHKKPEITRLIHENFWIVLSFALAQPLAGEIFRKNFQDHWKFMHKAIYEMAKVRADRASVHKSDGRCSAKHFQVGPKANVGRISTGEA